jgi:hypothetical protein
MSISRSLLTLAIAGLGLVWTPQTADADLILAGTINGSSFCAVDNDAFACGFGTQLADADATDGRLGLADGTFGGLTVEGSSHRQTLGPPTNILSSSSLNIINTSGADVAFDVAVGATDFVGPINTAFTTGSGTWINAVGSTINLEWWNDPANDQGAETPGDTPGGLVDSFTDTPTVAADSFNHVGGPFLVNDPAAFSMTLRYFGTLADGAVLNSRGQAEIKPVADVSAPATLLLLGSGLGLLGWRRWKSRA